MQLIMLNDFSWLDTELDFAFSRSSGPGGQNVNKVNTKVTVRWHVKASAFLNDDQKEMIVQKLGTRITKEGLLIVASQSKRTQAANQQEAIRKVKILLTKALAPKKKRLATKATIASKQKRLESKRRHSNKKTWRQKLE
jgi:ribosome-associated protein